MLELLDKAVKNLSTYSAYPEAEDISFAEWAVSKGVTSDKGKQMVAHTCRALVGREADDVGAHYILEYIKSGKGLVSLSTEDEYGAQALKVKPGRSFSTVQYLHR